MSEIVETGGGLYDPTERPIYFIAILLSWGWQTYLKHDYWLLPMNEANEGRYNLIDEAVDMGRVMLLDSGVYSLVASFARDNFLPFNQALSIHPDVIPSFSNLYQDYCEFVAAYEDDLWGYIELDIGGPTVKTELRKRLEGAGFNPIPVYHPLTDPPEYASELCENYDRIAMGNFAQSPSSTRAVLIRLAWRLKMHYPHVWIHLLGATASQRTVAYPVDSVDSSTWSSGLRWPESQAAYAACKQFSKLSDHYQYYIGDEEGRSRDRGAMLGSYIAGFLHRSWRNWFDDLSAATEADLRPYALQEDRQNERTDDTE